MPSRKYNIYIRDVDQNLIVDWDSADKNETLHFKINSNGGDLFTAVSLMRKILKDKRKVITENCGNCLSGGLTIFIAGDERLATKESLFLFHNAKYEGKQKLSGLDKLLKICNLAMIYQVARLTKISNKPPRYWMDLLRSDKDAFFNGKEMKRMGIVTKLI